MTQPRPASGPSGSAAEWRAVRRAVNENRPVLTAAAAGLHGDVPRVAGTALLCWPAWLPGEPVDLAAVPLRWSGEAPPPAVDGSFPAAAHVLPRLASGQPYPAYAAAIEALDRPALFENRVCYRLLSAAATQPAVPEPAIVPEPAVPEPAVPEPAVPEPVTSRSPPSSRSPPPSRNLPPPRDPPPPSPGCASPAPGTSTR